MSKKTKTLYEELKEYVDDYIKHLEKINKERLKSAEREVKFTQMEALAFNLLRQNITNLEASNGVS